MKPRKPNYQFANRLLPDNFFREPKNWMQRLQHSGGLSTLHNLWRSQDCCYELNERMDVSHVQCSFPDRHEGGSDTFHDIWQVILISFPPPETAHEPYFAAMVRRPAQAWFSGLWRRHIEKSQYFVTEQSESSESARLIEWLSTGNYIDHGLLETPLKDTLLRTIERVTQD